MVTLVWRKDPACIIPPSLREELGTSPYCSALLAQFDVKKLLVMVLFALIFCTTFSCTVQHDERDLFGVWKGEYDGKEVVLKFDSDHTFMLSHRDKVSDSMETIQGDFEVDFSKEPIPLTVRNIPQLNHPLHTIILFQEDGSMKMANFAPRWRLRPIAFNKRSSMILRRTREGD